MTRLVSSLALLVACSAGSLFAQEFGSIKGRMVFNPNDKLPDAKPIIAKGAATKDPTICAADAAIPDDSLLVDAKGGIANVFIYLKEAPATIHPDLKEPPKDPVPFDQKNCVFEPHALFTRAGQGVAVSSSDACAHNTHTFPLKNDADNFLLPPKPPKPHVLEMPVAEILPIVVKCDIHSWMTAYWLILDHPYAAVTKADGTFEIKNLPVGEHSFRVWHERAGYLDRGMKVTVKADDTVTIEDQVYDAKDF